MAYRNWFFSRGFLFVSLEQLQRLTGHGDPEKREKDDFYATPDYAIDALLDREIFQGEIWEPACGDGAICKRLEKYGYTNVYASDLVDRGYGDVNIDFMTRIRSTDNIITNPPFNIGTKFTLHALRLAQKKVAIFNKLTFLEGKERRDKLYCQNHLKNIYVFSERVGFKGGGGMLAFAWFVFDKEHNGKPTLEWI
jgi:hypothetical protein